MTDSLFVRDAEYAILDLGPQRRFVAQALVRGENSGVAVLRVNPEAVTGIKPLPLANRTVKRLRRGATIVAAAHQPDGTGLSLVRGVVSKIRSRFILHDARLTAMDFGGPLMNTEGVVIGVSRAGRVRSPDPSSATPVWLRPYLEQARDRAMELPLPSARALSAVAEGIQGPKDAVAAPSLDTDPADYRIRSGKRSLEFLTPRLLRALEQRADFRVIPGETPWGWVQHAGVRDPIVVVQVVPDLRWTGGSYFRVAGRLVSYPVMVVAQVFILLIEALGGADHPLVLPAELTRELQEHLWADIAPTSGGTEGRASADGDTLTGPTIRIQPNESDGRWTNGFPFIDDLAGRSRRATEDRRSASRYARHRTDSERPLRGPAAARKGAARRR